MSKYLSTQTYSAIGVRQVNLTFMEGLLILLYRIEILFFNVTEHLLLELTLTTNEESLINRYRFLQKLTT